MGNYEESLIAPDLPFMLRGDANPDTGIYPRPTIDITNVPGQETLPCLLLSGDSTVVEQLIFRSLRDSCGQSSSVGIVNDRSYTQIRYCVFDSLCWGITGRGILDMENCLFLSNREGCLYNPLGTVHATDCLFSGCGFQIVTAGDSSHFNNCSFRDNDRGHLLIINGCCNLIENCVFGPYGPWAFSPVVGNMFGGEFIDCLFTDMLPEQNVVYIYRDCNEHFIVRNCRFENIQGGGNGVGYACDTDPPYRDAVIRGNDFVHCSAGPNIPHKMISTQEADAVIDSNRFADLNPPDLPTIRTFASELVMRDNFFFNTGYALQANAFADARWNWWGDSTGPCHTGSNPFGQGDSITGNVEINPWYIDTLGNISAADELVETPDNFSLTAYPNPFNPTTTIKLYSHQALIIRLDIFDILSRKVKELYSGPVMHQHEFTFTADNLPSGIYFARAYDILNNRPLKSIKLVLLK